MLFRFTLQATLATAAAAATATATAKVDDEKTKKDPFVPHKLKQKYEKLLSNKKSNTIVQTLNNGADNLILQNQKAVPIQPILLKNPVTTTDTTTSGGTLEDIEEASNAFDASNEHELGILANAKSNVRTQQQRKLSVECDGKHPVVNPTMNFFALVRRCLVPAYQDNCPFDITLPLDCWDTSQVTDMKRAFYGLVDFNQPLNSWDVSSVTDFSDMFGFAASFNQPLDKWDMSSANDVSDMFWGATSFNQPLESWDTSSIQNMDYMFLDARSFNQPLASWDTTAVTDMKYMFTFAESFDQPLNSWDTSQVKDMEAMFAFSNFNHPLSSWNVERVTTMNSMFLRNPRFNQNLDCFNTRSVQDMTYMFNQATSFNQCLSTWAYKSPTALTGPNIFNGTSCSVQGVPDTLTGPWCQDASSQCYPSNSVFGTCDPSSSAKTNYAWTSAILFGAFLTSEMIVSFVF